ncbi:APC family permease [Aerosakkonema funiforme]|uniref:APC family permease n=1 Tax=Aerosakkonema funiforme TaxID=1246630 RepID=UPI0035B8AFF6
MSENLPVSDRTNQNVSGLRAECLSFPEIISQSFANVAPTAAPTVSVGLVFANAGNGTWLTFAIAMIGVVFVGLNISQFARRSASPGSLYAYISMGLGSTMGVISGWSLLLAYLFAGMAVVAAFSNFANVLLSLIGLELSPIFLFAICTGVGWYLAYKDIQLSTKLMLGLEAFSVSLLLLIALIVLFKHGFAIDMSQLSLKDTKPDGLILGLILAIFSYTGFESATALGDEAKNPLKFIPAAVVLTPILCGLFFTLLAYTEVLAFSGYSTPLDKSDSPINDVANIAGVGFLGLLITIGALVTFFSCVIACINAGSRILFTMARHGIFHNAMGLAHRSNRTPHIAITMLSIILFIVPASMSLFSLQILDIITYMGTLATYGFLTAYISIAIAAPVYLYRQRILNILDIAIAVLAVLFMLIPVVGSVYPAPPFPFNVFPYLFLMYLCVGGAWFLMLRLHSPEVIENIEDELEKIHAKFSEMKKI